MCRNNLVIRSLATEDAVYLAKWLSDPQVLEFYEGRDRPFTLQDVQEKFYRENDRQARCLIEFTNQPIGYMQYYDLEFEERSEYGFKQNTEKIMGMDQFIGEPQFWNKGMGKQCILMMLSFLTEEFGADRVVLDPQIVNKRAIRCYEKCGFRKVRVLPKHEWHEGALRDCILMEFKP